MKRIVMSWSSGKDSAWALHVLRRIPEYEIVGLLTTMNVAFDRVAMHAVRRPLLEAQAISVGLPLTTVDLPWPCSNEEYEKRMLAACRDFAERSVTAVAFGDLFLADVRSYRERQLKGTGLAPLFPLWEMPTAGLARTMISAGLRARLTCVDLQKLSADFAGREFNSALLAELPSGVDPCGEYGEFHTFCYAGPMFPRPLDVEVGQFIDRDGFEFADLMMSTPHAEGHG